MTKIYFSDRCGLHPQFLAPKTLGIFCRYNWVYVKEGDFWISPQGRGWLPGEPIMWFKGWNFQSQPLISGEGRRAWGWISGHWPMSSSIMTMWWSLHKTPKGQLFGPFWRAFTWRARMLPCGVPSSARTEAPLFRTSPCVSSSGCWFISFNVLL